MRHVLILIIFLWAGALHGAEIEVQMFNKLNNEYALGTSTQLELLMAQTNVNTDKAAIIEQETLIKNTKRNLAYVMGNHEKSDFAIEKSLIINDTLKYDTLYTKTLEKNNTIQSSLLSEEISKSELKLIIDSFLPSPFGSLSYSTSDSNSGSGFISQSSSDGLQASAGIQWNLFNGGKRLNTAKNYKLSKEIIQQETKKASDITLKELKNTYQNYQKLRQLISLRKENINTTTLRYEQSKKLYDLGQITLTDLRDMEIEHLQTQQIVVNTLFELRLSELLLYQISGELLSKL